jgi:hypothetical protein
MKTALEGKEQKNNRLLYGAVVAIAVVLVIVSILFLTQKKEMSDIVDGLNEEKTILIEEYQKLIFDFDSLKTENTLQTIDNDNIMLLLDQERERISQLHEEIKTIKATNRERIRELQKELTTLRGVLRSYVIQIDSLNTRNEQLTKENKEYRQRYTQIQTSVKKLENEKANLEQKVSIASQLDITNIMVQALNANGKKTERSGRTAKIRVCFTVLKNITAPVGTKNMYLRLERPDGQLLMHSKDDLFTYENSQINYSATRSIEYGGDETDVCIFYDADAGELMKGIYIADIFADGFHIGSLEFSLK